jgi:uncharacterized RDD family membrane protein YckC
LPSEVTIAPVIYPLATKWPRFFARTFDIWWENMIVAFALVFLLSRQSADFVEWINTDTNDITFGLLCLPISLILDAFFYYFIGNTPGKALLGLKVDTIEGKSLTFVQYLGRNFSMWLRGLALGFPLFNLVTMSNQASRLGKLQQTSYDEPNGYRVRAKPIVWASKLVFTLAYIILLVFIGASRR